MTLSERKSGIASAVGAGPRSAACAFGFNNTFYIMGGLMDTTQDHYNFASTPLPITSGDKSPMWAQLPNPPSWQNMRDLSSPPQFDCACTKHGKVFLFGNNVGFAIYDITKGSWDAQTPTFETPGLSLANLQNQAGLRAAVHSDGYHISVVATSPPTYMVLNSEHNTIQSVSIPDLPSHLYGYCLGVIPDSSQPALCGGSKVGIFSGECFLLHLTGNVALSNATSIPDQLEGCALVPYKDGFFFNHGYHRSYASLPPYTPLPYPGLYYYYAKASLMTLIPKTQLIAYPVRWYVATAVMPGSNVAIFYGGGMDGLNFTSDFAILNMTDATWVGRLDPVISGYYPPMPDNSTFPTPPPDGYHGPTSEFKKVSIAAVVVLWIAMLPLAVLGIVQIVEKWDGWHNLQKMFIIRRQHYYDALSVLQLSSV
ncbi:hypothetical protein MVEG_11148 [Podila verticillata NRRL 6337]|uniref:Uncharacterized protein n=1 Tax=Podila verticillata NRRL 6337 TaxID=1069443 RepID=A0A086TMD4_9FUNG|nr:hypothetical protein MVEG_11148 [Podila verticillata NRRL 6337]